MFRPKEMGLFAGVLSIAMIAAAPAPADARPKLDPEAKLAKMLEGRVAGEPRNCIPLNRVSSSQIIDKTAIVYRDGSTLWVNRPASGASSLDDRDVMVTKTVGSQLCSIDTVQLVDSSSRSWNGFVSLGEFIPYRKVD